jgi:uncharacterized protein (TIGR02284 family)
MMTRMELRPETLEKIQQLIVANFAGRDELYTAADSLEEGAQQRVCRRLAEHLAGYAVELQQILTAAGERPAGPLDLSVLAHALYESARRTRGQQGVLAAAAEREHDLKVDYDRAMDNLSHPQAENLLRRQRDGVEFDEQVLHGLRGPEQRADET